MYESAGAQFFDDSDINLAYGKNNYFKEEITMISKERKQLLSNSTEEKQAIQVHRRFRSQF